MKKLSVFVALLFVVHSILSAQWVNMKNLKVAVLEVVSRVKYEQIDTETLTEMLQVAFVDKNEFKIVERSLIEKIIKEQQFQVESLTEDVAMKIGSLSGANKVMMVSLSKLSNKYILIVKAVDTTTGVVDLTDQVMSYTVDGFIEVFPILADRFISKARGAVVATYTIKEDSLPASGIVGNGTLVQEANDQKPQILKSGLIGEWLFNGNFDDTSGFENHGKPSNVSFCTDRNGAKNSACYFSGNSAVDISGLPITQSFSISAWLYIENYPSSKRGYQIVGADGSIGFGIGENGKISGNTKAGGYSNSPWKSLIETETFAIKVGAWEHVVFTRSSKGDESLYIRGILKKHMEYQSATIPNYPWGCFIGAIKNSSGFFTPSFMNGTIDDVRIYNRVLSESEIDILCKSNN